MDQPYLEPDYRRLILDLAIDCPKMPSLPPEDKSVVYSLLLGSKVSTSGTHR